MSPSGVKFTVLLRVAMSLSMLGSVIWSLSHTLSNNNSIYLYDAFMTAAEVADGPCTLSPPLSAATSEQAPSQQHDKDNEFALCLKIMDANHEIIEWLAYQYHSLNMRRLIVYQDMKSVTTPKPIFDRWKDRINVTIWTTAEEAHPNYKPTVFDHGTHLKIQNRFYKTCFEALKDEGYRWVGNFDADEYVTINERVYIQGDPLYQIGQSHIQNNKKTTMDSIPVPSAEEPGWVLHFLRNATDFVKKFGARSETNPQFLEQFQTPCFQMTRKQYSPYESSNTSKTSFQPGLVLQRKGVHEDPAFPFHATKFDINSSQLSTWRWRYFGKLSPNKHVSNPVGKALMDFSLLQSKDFNPEGIHLPLKKPLCNTDLAWSNEKYIPLVLNHYPLSWEQSFMRQHDSRALTKAKGNLTQYRMKRFLSELENKDAYEPHGQILGWLSGFVNSVGKEEAARLLQHAADPIMAAKGAWLNASMEDEMLDKIVPSIPWQAVLEMDQKGKLKVYRVPKQNNTKV